MKSTIYDIHSYCVFANIDDRKGNIKGYRLILSKEQMEAIEQIVLSEKVEVLETPYYDVEDE